MQAGTLGGLAVKHSGQTTFCCRLTLAIGWFWGAIGASQIKQFGALKGTWDLQWTQVPIWEMKTWFKKWRHVSKSICTSSLPSFRRDDKCTNLPRLWRCNPGLRQWRNRVATLVAEPRVRITRTWRKTIDASGKQCKQKMKWQFPLGSHNDEKKWDSCLYFFSYFIKSVSLWSLIACVDVSGGKYFGVLDSDKPLEVSWQK